MPRILKKCHFSDRKSRCLICFCILALLGFFRIITLTKAGMRILKKCHFSEWKLRNAKKGKIRKKGPSIFRKCLFPSCKGHNFGHVAAPKKGENGALYRDGFCECVFYQGEKPNFNKDAILTKTWKKIKKEEKCPKIHLARNGSPKYRKQSTWRGCPTATDAPDMIFKQKLMKNVDFWRSLISEKTNERRRILQ